MPKLTIKSEMPNLKVVSTEIVSHILKSRKNTHTDLLFDIKLCIEEAVRNAIVHGNKSQAHLPVDITYDIKDNKVAIAIEDSGKGFDLKKLPDPTHEANLYRESGRGVYLMHRLMDKVEYNDKGNRVTMERDLG